MTIRVSSAILGRSLAWTFPGEGDLHRWASECPWNNRGGVLVASVRDPLDLRAMMPCVEEEVLRYARGQPINCIRRCLSDETESLKQMLGEEIGWKQEDGGHQFRERLRIHHADLGASIYFIETNNSDHIAEADNWVELFSKAERAPAVCFVFVCLEAVALGAERVARFTSGALAETLLSTADDRDERQLWLGYIVQRFVWESGGSPGIFELMEQSFVELVDSSRKEGTLERALSVASRKLLETHQAPVKNLIDKFSTVSGGNRGDQDALVAAELELQGMLWRPRQVPGWILPGWVARAIAPQKASTDPWLLRRSLNCTTLAGEVVALCTGLELKIRQQHLRNMEVTDLPPYAEVKLSDWYAGRDTEFVQYSSAVSLKPSKKGAAWNDAWAFTDLGDLENALRQSNSRGLSVPVLSALGTLRRIRNSVAHGHPVSWNHIRELRNVADII
jgi:hypothetical protein